MRQQWSTTSRRPTMPEDPKCGMCDRPARFIAKPAKGYAPYFTRYCGGASCTNPVRTCRQCGGPFRVNVDGAGTRYCSLGCKHRGYGQAHKRLPGSTVKVRCRVCGGTGDAYVRNDRTTIDWWLCGGCLAPIATVWQRLRGHRVPWVMVRRLLDDPTCEICGDGLLETIRRNGHITAALCVDHDHQCCPGERSCGRCVRGLLCPTCNLAVGFLRDDVSLASALGRYLRTRSVVNA